MKITVCAKCGSQDLERLAWVTLRSKQMTEFVDHNDFPGLPIDYCNNCGDRCGTIEMQYSEKYATAYYFDGGNDPALMAVPQFKDGRFDTSQNYTVEIDRAFDKDERRKFYDEMLKLFSDDRSSVMYVFRPYIDEVKEFVEGIVARCIEIAFCDCHQHFNTNDGGIQPLQQLQLDKLQADLVDLITQQVKQNL